VQSMVSFLPALGSAGPYAFSGSNVTFEVARAMMSEGRFHSEICATAAACTCYRWVQDEHWMVSA
jgi:hypothetical protein